MLLLLPNTYGNPDRTRVPWKIENREKSLRKSGSPEQNLACYLGTRNQGAVFQVPCRINMAVCPQPEPVLQCLLHSSLSWGTLRTGKIIQCACLGDRACCSVIRLDSALCRHHFILKTEPCLFLWGIFYDIIRMSLFFFAAQVYHAEILGGSLSWKCTYIFHFVKIEIHPKCNKIPVDFIWEVALYIGEKGRSQKIQSQALV